ncbi:YidC/Oxa1 family membrane protein insertase [Anaerotruncus sp. G3(2012)]|uniref:membrane protein insertase YidC n=1 Tax=Anaerotruncus sp. G3(2012) TaxID=1235835 RepID=UPI00033646B6|nr:membrane protein insertase YidC [Anaerotruncus sp. G3(2012)]EOS56752.1 YidC/Oxa1 family membrane protein insertase [Anaerotruncus sp. G3(2012)]
MSLTEQLAVPLNALMMICYRMVGHYLAAILIFTLLTKVILFPVSLWTHRNGITMIRLMPELNRLKVKYYGDKDTIAEKTQALYKQRGYHPLASTVPMFIQLALLIGVIGAVQALLAGTESVLSVPPAQAGGMTLLMPLAAGGSALLLGLAQNQFNPLQREQARASQWAANGVSIGISLLLGAFVPVGVGVYWIASNLLTIGQQLVLNAVMPARNYVDYEALEQSKQELAGIDSLSSRVSKEDRQREKADYKRFFSIANKHLVFYSESSGFYKYFADVIDYLLQHSNLSIHYITSDPNDAIFQKAQKEPRIRPYYIGEKRLITLMMKMDADMVVMTTPDLDNFYLKKSYVKKDVEYIYTAHGVGSTNLLLRNCALAHFDTIFCIGPYQIEELREEEYVYNLPSKTLVPCGYGLLDSVMTAYDSSLSKRLKEKPQVLIAPSWQPDNILDTCIDPLLDSLLCGKYHIILRPHPEYCKRYPQKIAILKSRYKDKLGQSSSGFELQTDFSSNETVFESDIVITDWSTICYEFSFATKRPTLFVNTPMKVMNPDYQRLKRIPLDIEIREKIGRSISPDTAGEIERVVEKLLMQADAYAQSIEKLLGECLFNPGQSGMAGGKYIIDRLLNKQSID